MIEAELPDGVESPSEASLLACVATILEVGVDQLPVSGNDESAPLSGSLRRWLATRSLGLVAIADSEAFEWAGPWIAWLVSNDQPQPLAVVMFGIPSGPVWDPAGATDGSTPTIRGGLILAPLDVGLVAPVTTAEGQLAGTVSEIRVAPSAGDPTRSCEQVEAIPGKGLDGDRHAVGKGTFPSFQPGSDLTLIEAEVCDSFDPPLGPDEHRRNLVTEGIDLNQLVGVEFTVGEVRCRGARLCEPCRVVDGYASRPILRALVHRGGLRVEILNSGTIRVGDPIRTSTPIKRS